LQTVAVGVGAAAVAAAAAAVAGRHVQVLVDLN
jgi:hypothetical protein